jgi:BNR/Asp-box repeat
VRVRRSFLISGAVTLAGAAAAIGIPMTAGAASGPPQPGANIARRAAEKADQAFEARMAARTSAHAAAATAAPLAGTAAGSAFTKISNAGQISRDTLPAPSSAEIEPDTQTEPDIAIDPANTNVMTADFQQGRNAPFGGSQGPGYATSQDGGRTWADGNLPMLTTAVGGPFQLASDAAVAFGPDGSDYAQTIPFDETDPRSAVAVQRSTDGGIGFGPPSLVVDDNNVNIFNDKNWIAVDTFRGSPHYGRIYSVWSRFITTGSGSSAVTHSPGAVSYSDDQGKTWSPIHFTTAQDANTEGLIPLIHPDGSVTVVYDLTVGSKDYETAQTSHDGGNTWSPGVTVGQFLGAEVPGMRTGGLPAAAIDASTGHMFVVWQDTRFNPSGLNDIVLSASADGGRSWSSPRPVSPKGASLDRFTPAVAAAGGAVHVTYRTRGANGTAPSVSEDYIASTDGAATFGPQQQVGPPSVLKWAAVSDESPPPVAFLGDYMGVAVSPAAPQTAELVWCLSAQPPVTGSYHQTTWAATASR